MAVEDPRDLDRVDQDIRINELKEEARELAGGEMTTYENPNAPPEIMEQFWRNVVDHEKAPLTSEYEQLAQAGLVFPSPECLSDQQLKVKLWELIEALARRNTYLYQTDHLSDRELYTHLLEDSLHEMGPELPRGPGGWRYTIDLLGGCSEEDLQLHFTYFADEQERAEWLQQFPDFAMPAPKPKPHDRDRLLPIPSEEQERRQWLADMHAQGYTDEDIARMCREDAESFDEKTPDDLEAEEP